MPELPEVETMRRGILAAVGGQIRSAHPVPCAKKPIAIHPAPRQLTALTEGKRLEAIDRLGKRLLLRLSGGWVIVIEPRMTGLIALRDLPDRNYLRFCVELEQSDEPIWFWDRRGLGTVTLYNGEEFQQRIVNRIGPDALDMDDNTLQQKLSSSRRAVKVALLDQAVVAGIGNIYASEALHRARIHPDFRCDAIVSQQWQRLTTAILEILHDAIRYEGSTLSDGTYRVALDKDGSYQNHHRVYDREGFRCSTCSRGKIRRVVQAARSTFFCPVCQRGHKLKLSSPHNSR